MTILISINKIIKNRHNLIEYIFYKIWLNKANKYQIKNIKISNLNSKKYINNINKLKTKKKMIYRNFN
jgi:hypothetical protein